MRLTAEELASNHTSKRINEEKLRKQKEDLQKMTVLQLPAVHQRVHLVEEELPLVVRHPVMNHQEVALQRKVHQRADVILPVQGVVLPAVLQAEVLNQDVDLQEEEVPRGAK